MAKQWFENLFPFNTLLAAHCCLLIINVDCLVVPEVHIPRYPMLGETATLKCLYQLENDILYSLTWWKDGSQFLQYKPDSHPSYVVFSVPGVNVSVDSLSDQQVELLSVTAASSGQYRCELVGEGPPFTTTFSTANLSVIHTPHGPPVIRGLKDIYHDGDTISLSCTSYRSFPPTHLYWSMKEYEQNYPLEGNYENFLPQAFTSQSLKQEYLKVKKMENVNEMNKDFPVSVSNSVTEASAGRRKDFAATKPSEKINVSSTRSNISPTVIPFTYSDHRNRSQDEDMSDTPVSRVSRSASTKQSSDNNDEKFGSFVSKMDTKRNNFASSFSSVRVDRSNNLLLNPTYNNDGGGVVHYVKRNTFGWKEIKVKESKSKVPKDKEQIHPSFSFLNDYPSHLDSLTTLKQLTLPYQMTSSTSTPSSPFVTLTHYEATKAKEKKNNHEENKSFPTSYYQKDSSIRQLKFSSQISSFKRNDDEGRARVHYYRAPRNGGAEIFRKIEEKFTKEQPPITENIWSDEDEADNESKDSTHQTMPKYLYTNSLSIKLPVTRMMARRGLITLRCTAAIHLYESSTAVQVKVAPLQVSEPHHLPTLLNTGQNSGQASVSPTHPPHVLRSLLLSIVLVNIIIYSLFQ